MAAEHWEHRRLPSLSRYMNRRHKPTTKTRIWEELLRIGTIGFVVLKDKAEGSANFHASLVVQGIPRFHTISAFEDMVPEGFHLPYSNTSLSAHSTSY